jgi:hypothetical protein
MKLKILSLLILITVTKAFAQDIDLYTIKQDDKFAVPALAYGMNLDEFQVMSRNLRMKDMMYAMIVPGYVHFMAKDTKTGYYLLGLRLASFGALTAVGLQTTAKFNDFIHFRFDDLTDRQKTPVFILANSTIVIMSISTIFGTYFYDWIHGQYRLQRNQELIRYKYSVKFNIENTPGFLPQNQVYPTVGLKLTF